MASLTTSDEIRGRCVFCRDPQEDGTATVSDHDGGGRCGLAGLGEEPLEVAEEVGVHTECLEQLQNPGDWRNV